MGLKDYTREYYTSSMNLDKIRPKWDWKRVLEHKRELSLIQIKSDQNGIERIKLEKHRIFVFVFSDKIRPKWDWKVFEVILEDFVVLLIKSDQNGIESVIDIVHHAIDSDLIKSDQNGIESFSFRSPSRM